MPGCYSLLTALAALLYGAAAAAAGDPGPPVVMARGRRTCAEIRAVNPTAASGFYLLDPLRSGGDYGRTQVYCHMSGEEAVTVLVNRREGSSCSQLSKDSFERLSYNTTSSAIAVIIQRSAHCSQEIDFTCRYKYKRFSDRLLGRRLWVDKNNKNRHTCECGSQPSCEPVGSKEVRCYCDPSRGDMIAFAGKLATVTNHLLLPVTALSCNSFHTKKMTTGQVELDINVGKLRCHGTAVECPSHQFHCWDTGRCVPGEWVCDGTDDCGRGEDEADCYTCSEDHFQCDGDRCIPQEWKCNQDYDCEDRSDEDNCAWRCPGPDCTNNEK